MARTRPSSGVQVLTSRVGGKDWWLVWEEDRLRSRHRWQAAAVLWSVLYIVAHVVRAGSAAKA